LKVSVIRPIELGPDEIAIWRGMQAETSSLLNPFMSPEFALAVDRARADARVAVLADGPEIVGFFPFQRRALGLGSPIGAGINDWQGLVHAPGFECDARELLKGCKLSVWHFDHLPEAQLPFGPYAASIAPAPVVDLRNGFSAYYRQLKARSPKLCQTLGRKQRRMAEILGEIRLVVGSKDRSVLRTLMAWKSAQCRRNNWISPLGQTWVADVFDDLLDTNSDGFESVLSVLYAGDKPVSAHFDLRASATLAIWVLAYETKTAQWSPGMIQNVQLAEHVAVDGVTQINFGKGTEQYKALLGTDVLLVAQGIAARGPLHKHTEAALAWAHEHRQLLPGADHGLRHRGPRSCPPHLSAPWRLS
jgi:CelD/BcsL family acetyltransferase involved in cellulose biosynthesis